MSVLFDRACEVYVGSAPREDVYAVQTVERLRVNGLRVSFKVVKDDGTKPNTVEVAIFNLSESNRARFESKGVRLALLAGYGDAIAQIASGDVRHARSVRQGVDWVTKIEAGDGSRALAHARVRESFRPGTDVRAAIGRAVQALQLDPGNALARAQEIVGQFPAGHVQHGRAADELSALLEPRGYQWSIQDGRIEILKKGQALPEVGPLLSPDTGLVGAPEIGTPTKPGDRPILKVRSLLQPRVRPGQRFEVESAALNGAFIARKVTHTGDTYGNDWYTDIEGTPE